MSEPYILVPNERDVHSSYVMHTVERKIIFVVEINGKVMKKLHFFYFFIQISCVHRCVSL